MRPLQGAGLGQDPKHLRAAVSAAAHVTQMSFAVIFGTFAGSRMDERFGTSPLFLLLGCSLGTAAGISFLVRSFNETSNHDPDES